LDKKVEASRSKVYVPGRSRWVEVQKSSNINILVKNQNFVIHNFLQVLFLYKTLLFLRVSLTNLEAINSLIIIIIIPRKSKINSRIVIKSGSIQFQRNSCAWKCIWKIINPYRVSCSELLSILARRHQSKELYKCTFCSDFFLIFDYFHIFYLCPNQRACLEAADWSRCLRNAAEWRPSILFDL